jgi:hypothetical protein
MTDGRVMRITFISGFELFNDRPYHNYETWAQGWLVEGLGVTVRSEGLDDAVVKWAALVDQRRSSGEIPHWHVLRERGDLLEDWIKPKP